MNFIIKDVDVKLLSLLCLEDVFNIYQVNKYFKLLCDEALHDKMMKVNQLAERIALMDLSELTPKINILEQYQKLILSFVGKNSYSLLKFPDNFIVTQLFINKNGYDYHLSVFFDIGDDYDDIIYANLNTYGILNFLRYALYDGLIIFNI